MIETLPNHLQAHYSAGRAALKLALSDDCEHLVPILVFTDTTGLVHVIELADIQELRGLAADLTTVLAADRDQRELWRLELEYAV